MYSSVLREIPWWKFKEAGHIIVSSAWTSEKQGILGLVCVLYIFWSWVIFFPFNLVLILSKDIQSRWFYRCSWQSIVQQIIWFTEATSRYRHLSYTGHFSCNILPILYLKYWFSEIFTYSPSYFESVRMLAAVRYYF